MHSEYCNNMHLTVNTQKMKVMIFSRGKVRKYQNFMFGDSILDVTYEYVYLGVNFNYNTSFIKAIERHISRAKRTMFAIVTKSRRLSLPLDILFELFDRVVLLVYRPGYFTVHPPPPALSGPKFSNSENCCGSENAMPPKIFWDMEGHRGHFRSKNVFFFKKRVFFQKTYFGKNS